jgi:Acetyltransferase (GNAT) domain
MPESNQHQYRQFCAQAPDDFPLFMHDWYLDMVCGQASAWDAAIVTKGGRVVAVWPYHLKQKAIWRYVAMPLLGKFMGPYLVPDARSLDDQTNLMTQLWAQIPSKLAAFEQDFHYLVQNWLPLYWEGFRQTTRYSYVLDLTQPEAALWANIKNSYRRKIKKATPLLTVRHDLAPEALYKVCMKSFDRQGLQAPISTSYFERLYATLRAHGCAQPFFAVDASGAVHSAALLVWDRHSAYYLLGGDDPAYRQSGSGVLLQWAAIRYAQDVLRVPVFDFEGSMLPKVEPTRRAFGAAQRPYFRVQREWSWLWRVGKFLWR